MAEMASDTAGADEGIGCELHGYLSFGIKSVCLKIALSTEGCQLDDAKYKTGHGSVDLDHCCILREYRRVLHDPLWTSA